MGRKRTWPLPAIAAAALIAGACTTGATTALWGSAGVAPGTVVTSGNLKVKPTAPVWSETSSDVTTPQTEIDPATFLVRKGDTLHASYRFDFELQGDNMVAEARLTWPDDLVLPDGVTATYQASSSIGPIFLTPSAAVGTAPLSTPVIKSDYDDGFKYFLVKLDVKFDGIDDRTVDMSEEQQKVLDAVTSFELELNQIRR
ncbi:hypothetical protein JSO19_08830 [Leucobacter sp. UCMA 4100]|uniref:hypothetical protein n=1 Tax=Leucobacter sp. UCMA 4100 TaxID=2810534 RepID=UPI0022EA9DCA|nr:hypothetical protein [Leucobacter sp. UCMA 4100]MDA3147483.1 hypothetical protein [Leucobacter sp. UCMA 4100]